MKNNNNNKGFVLISVSIILAMIFIMYGALMSNVTTVISSSNSFGDGVKAYYIAESAAAYAENDIFLNRSIPVNTSLDITDKPFSSENIYVDDYAMSYEITRNDGTNYDFNAIGRYKAYTRKINVSISYNPVTSKFVITKWAVVPS